MKSNRQNHIQWLRAIAAVEVTAWHTDLVGKHFSTWTIQSLDTYRFFGGIGVELFFIVSGYVMCLSVPRYATGSAFIYSRIARIVPMYWIFTTLVIVAYWLNPNWRLGEFRTDFWTVVSSYLVLPQREYPILSVGWSLEHEMMFYVGLTLLLVVGVRKWYRLGPAVIGSFVTLGGVGFVIGSGAGAQLWDYQLTSPYMVLFALGWALCWASERGGRRVATVAGVAAAFGVLLLYAGVSDHQIVMRMLVATGLFLLAHIFRGSLQVDNVVNRAVSAIADASYSLYLSHWFVLSAAGKLLGMWSLPSTMDLPVRSAAMAVCVAFALAIYRYVERPIDRLLRRNGSEGKAFPVQLPVLVSPPITAETETGPVRILRRKPIVTP